jgi:drug/metabolite transporter (DMT)-like permease
LLFQCPRHRDEGIFYEVVSIQNFSQEVFELKNARTASLTPGGTGLFRVSQISGVWLVALGAAIWGTDSVLRTPLLGDFTSAQIVLLEHLFLALYAIPLAWINRRQLRGLTLKQWGALLFIAWGGSALATVLFTSAFKYGDPNVVLLLQKLQPVFVFLLARTMLRETLPRTFGLDLILALAGTYLLTFGFTMPSGLAFGGQLTAALLAMGAAALWGGSTVMGRVLLGKLSFETVTALRFLVALPLLAAIVATSGTDWGHMFQQAAHPTPFLLIFLQALLPGLLSLLLYYRGLSSTKASYATLAELSFPATGVTLNWVFLGQAFTAGQLAGFVLIWMIVWRIAKYQDARAN